MRLDKLVEKLEEIKELEVVGVMLYTRGLTNIHETYTKVNYFYNPIADNISTPSQYIVNNMDNIMFDTYEVGYSNMASSENKLGTLFITDQKEFTYRDILNTNIEDIDFYTIKKVGE